MTPRPSAPHPTGPTAISTASEPAVVTNEVGYAPGWTADAVQMMTSRSAADRADFCLRRLRGGERVVDLGCGPGTITAGLAAGLGGRGKVLGLDVELSQVVAARTATSSAAGARYVAASAFALPLPDNSVDVVFSHALFEHLSGPLLVLAEARRVLRVGGRLAVAASDWGRALLDPLTPDVREALEGHYALRRAAGGDPFAGSSLTSLVMEAGFVEVESPGGVLPGPVLRRARRLRRDAAAAGRS